MSAWGLGVQTARSSDQATYKVLVTVLSNFSLLSTEYIIAPGGYNLSNITSSIIIKVSMNEIVARPVILIFICIGMAING